MCHFSSFQLARPVGLEWFHWRPSVEWNREWRGSTSSQRWNWWPRQRSRHPEQWEPLRESDRWDLWVKRHRRRGEWRAPRDCSRPDRTSRSLVWAYFWTRGFASAWSVLPRLWRGLRRRPTDRSPRPHRPRRSRRCSFELHWSVFVDRVPRECRRCWKRSERKPRRARDRLGDPGDRPTGITAPKRSDAMAPMKRYIHSGEFSFNTLIRNGVRQQDFFACSSRTMTSLPVSLVSEVTDFTETIDERLIMIDMRRVFALLLLVAAWRANSSSAWSSLSLSGSFSFRLSFSLWAVTNS